MPANIAKVQLSDTFNQWVTQSNTTIDEVNTLLNGNFVKSAGSFTANGNATLANGSMFINKTDGVTLTNQGNTSLVRNLALGSITNVESRILSVPETAANTATVSANGTSIRIANTINFVQTDNIAVSITSGGSGVANIAFTVLGELGGGIQGVQGVQGALGAQGVQGRIGAQGVQGVLGTQGLQGTIGIQGVQGPIGSGVTSSSTTRMAYYSAPATVTGAVGVTYNSTLDSLNVSSNAFFTGNIVDTPVVTISGPTTYADSAAGKVILVDSTSDVTVTFDTALKSGFAATVVRNNTGNVTIAAGAGVTKVNSTSFTTSNISARYEAATVVYVATNQILVLGSIT